MRANDKESSGIRSVMDLGEAHKPKRHFLTAICALPEALGRHQVKPTTEIRFANARIALRG